MLAIVAVSFALPSCALLPAAPDIVFDDDDRQADARMEQIVGAINDRDAGAIKAMFSSRAQADATNLDDGVEYFLSFFASDDVSWERETVSGDLSSKPGGKSELLRAFYKVTVQGEQYRLYFADFTVNDLIDPENVGLYALGITPWTEGPKTGEAKAFQFWALGFQLEGPGSDSYPGVYQPAE